MLNIALAAAVLAAQAAQTPTQPAAAAPAAVWKLDWIEQQCQIATDTPGGIGTALRMTPGSEEAAVYLVGSPAQLPDIQTKSATVTLAPAGQTIEAIAGQIEPPGKRVLVLIMGEKFPAAFAKADEIRVVTDRGSVVASVKGAGEAMAALRTCMDEGLQEWGIDPKAHAALRQPPRKQDDRPIEAILAIESGRTVARLAIDAAGKVNECKIVVTSQSEALDRDTCRVLRRIKHNPAIGQDGRPAPAFLIYNINWSVDG